MGKCMRRKPTPTADVPLIELQLPQRSLGVRTRAKTLALHRFQSSNPDFSYLQLRSRRLAKPLLPPTPRRPRPKESAGIPNAEPGSISGGIENCSGGNNIDCGVMDGSTQCNLVRVTSNISQTCPSRNSQLVTAAELEEFFALEEESQQLLFIEKYNFDIRNDVPLPGRYEWVKSV